MNVKTTPLDGLIQLENRVFEDSRGTFFEVFKEGDFKSAGLPSLFPQDNISTSHRGVIRGLHFQIGEAAQGKLVRCVEGSIFDVAVDMRKGSKTFGKWFGVTLKTAHEALYIPPGFAHGFQALEDYSLVYYKCTAVYSASSERGIRFDDPTLAISWPLPPSTISDKDMKLPWLKDVGAGF